VTQSIVMQIAAVKGESDSASACALRMIA